MTQDWRVNGIQCDAEGVPETRTVGESETYRLRFIPAPGERPGANEHLDRFDALRRGLLEPAGMFETHESTITGDVLYQPRHDAEPLVSIQPPDSSRSMPGCWGVVESGGVGSPFDPVADESGDQFLTIDVLRLADFDRFGDEPDPRAAARSALEVEGVF